MDGNLAMNSHFEDMSEKDTNEAISTLYEIEEILASYCDLKEYKQHYVLSMGIAVKAMQQYAKQEKKKESVGFMEWKEDECYECVMYDDVKMWQKKGNKLCSSEQLYDLYIQSKQQ